jgi:hypothetical protein
VDSLPSRILTGREGEGEGEACVLRACRDDGAGMLTIPWELFEACAIIGKPSPNLETLNTNQW